MFSILANLKKKNKEEYEKKKYIKIQYIRFSTQRLRPLGHADSQSNKPTYGVIILNMLKEKSLSRQFRKMYFGKC